MEMNHKNYFIILFNIFFIILHFTASVATAQQKSDDELAPRDTNNIIRKFFLIHNNDAPAFWGNPIVISHFDETGKNSNALEKARAFATFYALAARVETAYFENTSMLPTLAYVVADHKLDGASLAQPLKKTLEEKWKGTPLFEALQSEELRTSVKGVADGEDCSIFSTGTQKNEYPSHYVVKSALIFANSKLSEREITLCFYNKTSVVFGLTTNNFNADRKYDADAGINRNIINSVYFSHSPTILDVSSICREIEFKSVLSCTSSSLKDRSEYLSNILDR